MITVELLTKINYILSIGTILGMIKIVFLLYDLKYTRIFATLMSRFGLFFALLTVLLGTVLTLVYSEIFGVLPCGLCWLERMMLYPQILITGTALYLKDKMAPVYGIVLSTCGLIISLYHHYIQMGGSEFVRCPASGADCAKRIIFEFGFVTFPFMAVVLFTLLIVLYIYTLKTQK